MISSNRHTAGARFVWHDLMTSTVEESACFYAAVFDWDVQLGRRQPPHYALMSAGDNHVGAAIAASEQRSTGNRWLPYLAIDDLDDFVERALRLGGRSPLRNVDVTDRGRFAVIIDPGGAVFAACELEANDSVPSTKGLAGAFGWHELVTDQPKEVAPFYLELCGWTLSPEPCASSAPYWYFALDRSPVAGIAPTAAIGARQSRWLCHVHQNDIAEVAARAKAHDGEILIEPTGAPALGQRALIADPLGGVLAVFRPFSAGLLG